MMEIANSLLKEARDIAKTLKPEDGLREIDSSKVFIAAEGADIPECCTIITVLKVTCEDGVERSFTLCAKT